MAATAMQAEADPVDPGHAVFKPSGLEGDASSPVLLKMGCTAIEVPLEEVQRHMKRVYSRALQSTLDASHLFTSDGWVHMITSDGVPLCRTDLLSVLPPEEVMYIEQALGHALQRYSTNSTQAAAFVNERQEAVLITSLVMWQMLADIHQAEQAAAGAINPDQAMMAELRLCEAVCSLGDCLETSLPEWDAVPLPLYVALSQGRLGAAVVALLHPHRLPELAARAAVVPEVLRLMCLCAANSGLCPLLLQPMRFSNEQVSAWAALQQRAQEAEAFMCAEADAARANSSSGSPGRSTAVQRVAALLVEAAQAVQAGMQQLRVAEERAAAAGAQCAGSSGGCSGIAAAGMASYSLGRHHAQALLRAHPASTEPLSAALAAAAAAASSPISQLARHSSTELRLNTAATGEGSSSGAAMAVDAPPLTAMAAVRTAKRPSSTDLDELDKSLGVSQRYSPGMISRAGVAANQFGAAAAAGGLASLLGQPAGSWHVLDAPVVSAGHAAAEAAVHRQLALGCVAPVQQQHQPLAAAVLESAARLSTMLHVSPPSTVAPGSPASHPSTPVAPIITGGTSSGALTGLGGPPGSPLSPGIDLPSTSLLFRAPGVLPNALDVRSPGSPSSSSSPSCWGTPSSARHPGHASHSQQQQPLSPEYSTWGSPASLGPGDESPMASAPGALLPLPLSSLSNRLAAMAAISGVPVGPSSPLRRSSAAHMGAGPADVDESPAQGGGGPNARPPRPAPIQVEYVSYDASGASVSLLDPGCLAPDSPMRMEAPGGGGDASGRSSGSGVASPFAAAAALVPQQLFGDDMDMEGGPEAQAAALPRPLPAIAVTAAAGGGVDSQPGTPTGDTAPQLDRRRSSIRQLPQSMLSRPPRRASSHQVVEDNDIVPTEQPAGHHAASAQQHPGAAADTAASTATPAHVGRRTSGRRSLGILTAASPLTAPQRAISHDGALEVSQVNSWGPAGGSAAPVPTSMHPYAGEGTAPLMEQYQRQGLPSWPTAPADVSAPSAPPLPGALAMASDGGFAAAAARPCPVPPLRMSSLLVSEVHVPPTSLFSSSTAISAPGEPCAPFEDTWGSPRSDDSMMASPRPNSSPLLLGRGGASGFGRTQAPVAVAAAAPPAVLRTWGDSSSSGMPSPVNAASGQAGSAGASSSRATGALAASALQQGSSSSPSSPTGSQGPDQDMGGRRRSGRARHRLASCSEPAAAEAAWQAPRGGHELLVCRALAGSWGGGSNGGVSSPAGSSGSGASGLDASLDQGGLAALVAAGADVVAGDMDGGGMDCDYGADNNDLHDQLGDGMSELVGARQPLGATSTRYALSSPSLAQRLCSLESLFPCARRVAGDGNCFFRGFLFALLEALLAQPDAALHARLRQRIEQVWSVISVHAPPDSGAARGFSLLTEFLGRVWWLDGSGSGGSSSGASAGLPQQQQQQQALYLQDLEVGLHQSSVFDPLVQFARLAASWEMRCNEERYSPFLAGCGYEGMLVAQVCDQYVERMGQEVEQLQVMALSHALEVAVGIVDVGGSEIGYLQHPSGAAAPLFWLVHLPGHYDIVYLQEGMDPRVLLHA